MFRKSVRAAIFAFLGMLATIGGENAARSADDKADISTIMTKSFGKDGYKVAILAAVKNEKWDDAAKLAKEWSNLGQLLGKNKPLKGDAKAWEKACAAFADNTKAVLAGTEKKDPKAISKAIGSFSCGVCHKAYRN